MAENSSVVCLYICIDIYYIYNMWNSLMHNVDVYIHFMHREKYIYIYIYTSVLQVVSHGDVLTRLSRIVEKICPCGLLSSLRVLSLNIVGVSFLLH